MRTIELFFGLSSFILLTVLMWQCAEEVRFQKLRRQLGIAKTESTWQVIENVMQSLKWWNVEGIRNRIEQAGRPWGMTPARYFLEKLLWPLAALAYSWQAGYDIWMMVVLAGSFFFFPDIYLLHKRKERLAAFRNELPEAIDTIEVAVTAEVPMEEVFLLAADTVERGDLKKELLTLSAQYFVTKDKEVSLNQFTERVPLPEAKVLSMAILQGERTGRIKEIIGSLSTGLFNSALAKVSRDEKAVEYKVLMAASVLLLGLLSIYFQAYFASLDQGLRVIF